MNIQGIEWTQTGEIEEYFRHDWAVCHLEGIGPDGKEYAGSIQMDPNNSDFRADETLEFEEL